MKFLLFVSCLFVVASNVDAQRYFLTSTDTVGRPFPLQIDDNITGLTYGTNTFGRIIRLSRQTLNTYDLGLDGSNEFFISKRSSTDPAIKITAAGNVGLGVANPTNPLEIYTTSGNIQFGGSFMSMTRPSFNYINASDPAGSLIFRTGGVAADGSNNRMIILSNGNVGIGTTSPGSNRLTVEGTIGARRVKITQQAAWADFVFDAAYKLPSLPEVENYIAIHKHLPDVPSAAEVAKDGIDVGDMNKVLLQKVEEQTLYLIDLKKENEKQQALIDLLMKKVQQLENK